MHHQRARIVAESPLGLFQSFKALANLVEAEFSESGTGMRLRLNGGQIAVEGDELSLEARDKRGLFSLQQMVIRQAKGSDPAVDLTWDHVELGALPPNFSPATVLSVSQISPSFRRVRLALADLERFDADALHFRLVIPALPAERMTGSIAELPVIGKSGAVDWPEGEALLHRPVYTLTSVNHVEGWIDFDIFLHDGGRVTAWSQVARPGDVIGLMGPTHLRRDLEPWVGFYGDETALPAIRLYLASLPPDTTGEAVITLHNLADAVDLPRPSGVKLDFLPWTDGALLTRVQTAPLSAGKGYLYAGCERREVDAIRRHARETLGLSKSQMNITSFWQAS